MVTGVISDTLRCRGTSKNHTQIFGEVKIICEVIFFFRYFEFNLILRNSKHNDTEIYRKPTSTDTTIHFSCNHLYEHKLASFVYYINRMLPLLITEQSKQQEWNTISTIAQNNGLPAQTIHSLKKKLSYEYNKSYNIQTDVQHI